MKRTIAVVLPLLLILIASLCFAGEKAWYMVDEIRLNTIRMEVEGWDLAPPSRGELNERLTTLQTLIGNASQCVTETEKELAQAKEKAAVLNETGSDEDTEIAKRRSILTTTIKGLEQRLAICRLLDLSARELQKQIIVWRQKNFASALLHRGPSAWEAVVAFPPLLASPDSLLKLKAHATPPDTSLMVLAFFFPLLFLLPMVITLDQRLKSWSAEDPELRRHKSALMLTRRLPAIALLTSMASGSYAGGIMTLAAPMGALALALALSPLVEYLFSRENIGVPVSLPLRFLITLLLLVQALIFAEVSALMAQPLVILCRSVIMLLLMGASMRALWLLSLHPRLPFLKSVRYPLLFCLTFGPIAEWVGYRNLAEFVTCGLLGTLAGGLIVWAILLGIDKAQGLLEEMPPGNPAQKLRNFLGYKPDEPFKGLKLISSGLTLALFVGYSLAVLKIWGLTTIQSTSLGTLFLHGFRMGDAVIVPMKLILAIFLFFLILNLSRWLKRQMEEKWLTHTSLDNGARQSIVTLTGYALTGFALFYSLSIAGLEFKNLAIIAGALSVGIGFGLQNIVNNFVSGLILLFERPVRPGDWVVVGGTEGYVKRVSIRSTLIQTFDRADVLVPNSDLISNQVTNWMLGDPFGRVIVPLGVAYGTDTRKVKEILLTIAEDHPMVLTNGRLAPKPKVIFKAFGDSSLDFELRCHIRDVDHRITVRSELLFAIDDAFRAAGIEIPFPQRVVHQAPLQNNMAPPEPQKFEEKPDLSEFPEASNS